MSISNTRHQYSLINQLINQLIDLSTDEKNGRRDTSVGQQTAVRIYRLIYQRRHGGHIDLSIQQQSDSCVPSCHVSSKKFPPVAQSKVVGPTVHTKAIHVMA